MRPETRATRSLELGAMASRIREIEMMPDSAQIDPVRAAEILTALGVPVAKQTLAKWRCVRSDGPAYRKIGKRVVYRLGDLRDFAGATRKPAA